MAQPKPPHRCLQLVALFSRHAAVLDWGLEKISRLWGQPALVSRRFDHSETNYYQAEMGAELRKQFVVVEGLFDPAGLPRCKLQSNAWEEELSQLGSYLERRPINIDPGYVTLTKLVLASCKDRAHRIYLADGIYAEECLYYLDRQWRSRPWTYPDYQRVEFHAFFEEARELLKSMSSANR